MSHHFVKPSLDLLSPSPGTLSVSVACLFSPQWLLNQLTSENHLLAHSSASLSCSRFPRNVRHLLGFQSYFRVIFYFQCSSWSSLGKDPNSDCSCVAALPTYLFLLCWYLISINPLPLSLPSCCLVLGLETGCLFRIPFFFFIIGTLLFSILISFSSQETENIRKHRLDLFQWMWSNGW